MGGVWPSAICAVNPARHGQYAWRQFDPAIYREVVPPYDDGEGVPLWRALDQQGLACAVVDLPRTIHVPLRRGVQVHDHGTHDPLAPGYRTWPPALADELAGRHGPPFRDLCDRWPRKTPGDVAAMLERTSKRIACKLAIVDDLAGRGAWDLLAVGLPDVEQAAKAIEPVAYRTPLVPADRHILAPPPGCMRPCVTRR